MIIYRFQVIQTSRDPSVALVMLLEPYGGSSPPYIELKWIYTGRKPNPLPFDEKSLTDKPQCQKNS